MKQNMMKRIRHVRIKIKESDESGDFLGAAGTISAWSSENAHQKS
jgi:hypothetical protein